MLVPKWQQILLRAWSIRFIVLAAALSGAEVAFTILTPDLLGIPPGTFAALAAFASSGALLSRILAQPGITERGADE